ncbi:partial RTX-I toxin determinant A from serotypes 1/9, partial [Methylococcales bacterium]
MSTIQQYYDYSQLSLTAYAIDLKVGILTNTSGLVLNKAGLTDQQITALNTDGWQVVGQSSDAMYGSSGFSATLFKNTQTGEYVFANRGTEPEVNDLAYADAWGIVIQGMASSQIIDMYRFYKQLITPQGQHVVYSVDELNALIAIKSYYSNSSITDVSAVFDLTQNDLGVGGLSVNQAFTTTGHSLGGHLSLWLDKLVPAVSHVYTCNGAGNGGFFQSAVTTVAGALTGTPFSLSPDSGTTNVFGYGGPAIISGVGGNVGANIPVDIEFKDPIDSVLSGLYNHSIVQLTDAMAVVNLFNKLDAGITTERFNDLFLKGSNEIGLSLEGLLDGLRSFFGKTDSTPNDNRDQFYINLYDLQNSTAFKNLIGQVTLTTPPTSANEARNDFGAFLSLVHLTPFALNANSIEAMVHLQTDSLANTELALQWEQDNSLTPEQRASGQGHYSDVWLNDRAQMLSHLLQRNHDDTPFAKSIPINQIFEDYALPGVLDGTHLILTGPEILAENSRQIIFGDDNANIDITGGNKNDHLYGGGGDDLVTGGKGNDYLEGGTGSDIYAFIAGDGMD